MNNQIRVWMKFVLGLISAATSYVVGNTAVIHADLKPHEKVIIGAGIVGVLTAHTLAFLDKSYSTIDTPITDADKIYVTTNLIAHGFNEDAAKQMVAQNYNSAKRLLETANKLDKSMG